MPQFTHCSSTCVAVRGGVSSPCVAPAHSPRHKCLFEHVWELIHTARPCLRHLRFPPMFNLAERRAERASTRTCSGLEVTGLIQKRLLRDTLSVPYTPPHTHTRAPALRRLIRVTTQTRARTSAVLSHTCGKALYYPIK